MRNVIIYIKTARANSICLVISVVHVFILLNIIFNILILIDYLVYCVLYSDFTHYRWDCFDKHIFGLFRFIFSSFSLLTLLMISNKFHKHFALDAKNVMSSAYLTLFIVTSLTVNPPSCQEPPSKYTLNLEGGKTYPCQTPLYYHRPSIQTVDFSRDFV